MSPDRCLAAGVRGTRGYAEQADELVARYEAIDFATRHASILPLMPDAPASVLDIGAGSGADAAWLAARAYRVVAVEPTEAMRSRAMALHPSAAIEWIDDSLPALRHVAAQRRSFDMVMLTAVWMHLDAGERRRAMPIVASLIAAGSLLTMTLRHGPVPAGRLMFAVSAEETIALADMCDLRPLLNVHVESRQPENRAAGVSWSHLAFRRNVSTPASPAAVPSKARP
ncbi:MAG: class I SAM-dependent methyltransferase [Caldimonas sp.]